MSLPHFLAVHIGHLRAAERSVVLRAVLLALLLGASMFAIVGWNSWNAYQTELDKTRIGNANRVKSLEQHANDTVKAADTILIGLVERLEVDGTGTTALQRIHHLLQKRVPELPQLHGIFIYGADGSWLTNSQPTLLANANNSDRAYFMWHRDHPDRDVHVGPPVRSKSTGEWIMTVTRRFEHSDGRFAGVVLATIDMDYFQRHYATFNVGEQGLILTWLNDGTLVARAPFKESLIGKKHPRTMVQTHFPGKDGTIIHTSLIDGVERIYSWGRLDDYPILVATAVATGEVFARWRSQTLGGFVAVALLLGIITLLGFRLIRQLNSSAQARAEREVADARISEQSSLLNQARDAIFVYGMDHRLRFWNKGAERLYGWSASEAEGEDLTRFVVNTKPEAFQHAMMVVLRHGEWAGETVKQHKDGSLVNIEEHWTLVCDAGGSPQSILAIETDITARIVQSNAIEKLAFFDSLTGLPNRSLLLNRLQHALATCSRNAQSGALLFIDLDHFKELNDAHGHDKGDALLKAVAARLTACVRECDTVARLGGDEFVLMLQELGAEPVEAARRARVVSEKILLSFARPFDLAGYEHFATASIGVALFSDNSASVDELFKRADLAMYQAKAIGRDAVQFFDPEMQELVNARVALEADLRQALAHDELSLHFQPQVDSSGRITGVEALIRWHHPVQGMVPPARFIPIAEESGLIAQIGMWVMRAACLQLAAWSTSERTAALTIAVNVSARQIQHRDFVGNVIALLDNTGANPSRLKLELTESVLIDDLEATIVKMDALKAYGIGFSLDDFGTGYSSLSYLKRMPLDQLKIDQSFVRDMITDTNGASIVRTILALGSALGQAVIAEGVETQEQHQFLLREGCRAFQGYYFSRPLPPAKLEALLRRGGASAVLPESGVHA